MQKLGTWIGLVSTLLAATAHADDLEQRRRGFVVRVGLGTKFLTLSGDVSATASFSGVNGELSLGWKFDRVTPTVGFELGNVTTSSTNSTPANSSSVTRSTSLFLVTPGVQIALLRSRDLRVELLASLRFGFGRTVVSESRQPAPPPAPPSTESVTPFSFMYELAPGVRYWVHPQFGLALLAGVRGDVQYVFTSRETSKSTQSVAFNAVFASLQVSGVF